MKRQILTLSLIILACFVFYFTQHDLPKTIAIGLAIFITMVALTKKDAFNEAMHRDIEIRLPFGITVIVTRARIAFIVFAAALIYWNETRIWSLQNIVTAFPTIGLLAQICLWLLFSHLISYATHGLLFVILWHKWKSFLPALIVTFLEMALSEFSFIGSQWYQFGFIFTWTWTWYIPFIIICFPYIASHNYFDLRDEQLWLTFILGMAFIYVNAVLGLRDVWTWDNVTHGFHLYPELIYTPTAWYNMFFNRIGKILMTFAFVFVRLKNGKGRELPDKPIKRFFKESSTYPKRWMPESKDYFLGKKAALIGKQLHRDIIDMIKSKDLTILDAGVGKGRLTNDLLLKEPKLLICVDINANMLKATKESVKNKNSTGCVLCDVEDLPFRDNTFDFAISVGLLMHLPRVHKTFSEFSRILSSNGSLITDNVNNSIIAHLRVVGLSVIQAEFLDIVKTYLRTRRVGSSISTSYSFAEHKEFHEKANLIILKEKTYGNKYFPWIFLTLAKRAPKN
jgi:ubiquinone/menaquinone biosynthesis C-methylase UbiE